MTLEAQDRFNNYVGNGVSTSFPYSFRCFEASDLEVTTDGSVMVLGIDYNVTGVGNSSGGSIVFEDAPVDASSIFIQSIIPLQQKAKYAEGGQFPAVTHETALDRMVAMLQEMSQSVKTSAHFPAGDTASGELPDKTTRSGGYLGFDADGNFVKMPPEAGTAAQVAADAAAAAASAAAAAVSAENAAQFDPALLVVSGSNLYLVDNYNALMY
jgi:hypothetical protein